MFGRQLVATDGFDDLQWPGPWMGRTQEWWELVMEPVPCPVLGRRIPGQGGVSKLGDDRQVEEGQKGHVQWDVMEECWRRPLREGEN